MSRLNDPLTSGYPGTDFDRIIGASPESYIWDEADVKRLLSGLNEFLLKLYEVWQSLSTISALSSGTEESVRTIPIHSFGLRPGSTLLSLVERRPPADAEITQPRQLELVFQITCLLTLAMVTMEFANDFRLLQEYMDSVHKMIEDLRLAGQSCNNAVWQIQVNDQSGTHSQRIWRAAGYVWVMKHVSYAVQNTLKDWLLGFFTGKPVDKVYRLDPFHFSYAN